jgi:hypothetical protein
MKNDDSVSRAPTLDLLLYDNQQLGCTLGGGSMFFYENRRGVNPYCGFIKIKSRFSTH